MNPSRSPYRQLLWILPLTVAGAVIALLLYVILTPGLSLDYEGTLLMGGAVLLAILIAGTFFIRTRETGLQKQRAGALLMGGLLMGYALVQLYPLPHHRVLSIGLGQRYHQPKHRSGKPSGKSFSLCTGRRRPSLPISPSTQILDLPFYYVGNTSSGGRRTALYRHRHL